MKSSAIASSALLAAALATGCAQLPPAEACATKLDREFAVLEENGHLRQNHRSPNFQYHLIEAEQDQLAGDYEGCLANLKKGAQHSHNGMEPEKRRIDARDANDQVQRQRSRTNN